MEIRSDALTESDVADAAGAAGVRICVLRVREAEPPTLVYDVELAGSSPVWQDGGEYRAATPDEREAFLAALLESDPMATVDARTPLSDERVSTLAEVLVNLQDGLTLDEAERQLRSGQMDDWITYIDEED